MLEDYIVEIAVPVESNTSQDLALGWQFGYNQRADQAPRYWDGQDVWLPPQHSGLRAICKGTLHLVNDGDPVHARDGENGETAGAEFPAIGPALVLKVWPQEYVKLGVLLERGSPVPKEFVYQNVDKPAAIEAAKALINDPRYRDRYKRIFTTEGDEGEISEQTFAERANRWIDTQWAEGKGMGILVNPGSALGRAAAVPAPSPDYPDSVEVDHSIPEGAEGWNRLTLKAIADPFLYFDPCFLFYLLDRTEEPTLQRPERETAFVAACCNHVELLPVVRLTHQLRDGWQVGDELDPNMPAALSDLVLHLMPLGEDSTPMDYPLPALHDPALDGLWRVQGLLHASEHQWRFSGPPLYAQCLPGWISSGSAHFEPQVPPQPSQHLGVSTEHWLHFDLPDGTRERRFILGVNMESCRRQNDHDLSANDMHFQYGDVDGPPTLTYTEAWLDDAANRDTLRWDLENIARTGARAVRVWVFEVFEGLHFAFTSQLLAERHLADAGNSQFLVRRVFYGEVFHACTRERFEALKANWTLRVEPADPATNPLWAKLADNARFLQEEAAGVTIDGSPAGLRIFWTLWVHYMEGGRFAPLSRWIEFIQDASTPGSGEGRLPVEAWIYRALMVDPLFRSSYVENALKPFVRAMESAAGQTIGYEVMNEPDFVWDGCQHRWANYIKGPAVPADPESLPTRWKLTETEVRSFIRDCAEGVRTVLGEVNHPDRIVISGIQSTFSHTAAGAPYRENVRSEMMLLRPGSDALDPPNPALALSASAMTRYALRTNWQRTDTAHFPHDDVTLPVPHHDFLRNHPDAGPGICLFTEAGDEPGWYDCGRQASTVATLLNQALQNGYAGVFVWHYNNPERLQIEATEHPNALTEGGHWVAGFFEPWTFPHSGHAAPYEGARFAAGRPACEKIWQFAHDNDDLLIPFL